MNRIWLDGGLRCDDPVEKMGEFCDLQGLWFPIKGLIGDMVILKKHGRIVGAAISRPPES
jgi:hypothetical protein